MCCRAGSSFILNRNWFFGLCFSCWGAWSFGLEDHVPQQLGCSYKVNIIANISANTIVNNIGVNSIAHITIYFISEVFEESMSDFFK